MPRPAKIPASGLQFNKSVQMDLFHLHDAGGERRWFLAVLDVATNYCVVRIMTSHSSEAMWSAWEACWLGWAGPPDVVVCDNERGLVSSAFVDRLAASGTLLWPTAAYAPWQKGRIERRIGALKETIRKLVMQKALTTNQQVTMVAHEAAQAYNQRLGPGGFSPAQRLFGTRARVYGELYHQGESVGWHPEALVEGSEVAARLILRRAAQEAVVEHEHQEAMARTVAARSRVLTQVEPGQRVYFYREVKQKANKATMSREGLYVGPGVVIGMHGAASAWIQYGSRVYLVALEHIRGLTPEEEAMDGPPLKEALEKLHQALGRSQAEYEDLTGEGPGEVVDPETRDAEEEAPRAPESASSMSRDPSEGNSAEPPGGVLDFTGKRNGVYRFGRELVRTAKDGYCHRPPIPRQG